MKKIAFLIGVLFLTPFVFAQKKELTLNDAVLNQYRTLGPDRIAGFQWLPTGDSYSFFSKNYQTLFTSSVKGKKDEEKLKLETLNTALGSELSSLYGLQWKDNQSFYINNGQQFYCYSLKENKGRTLYQLDKKAANALFDAPNEQVAYTIDNNVYITKKNGEQLTVTSFTDKNIVSGQSIARNEFGISGGLFWSPDGNWLAFYQKDESNVAEYPLVDITKTPGELMPIKYPMAGQGSEQPKVGIYNLNTQKTVYISPRGNKDDYLTNLAFTPDNQYVVIAELNRDQNHMQLNVYETATGKFVRTLLEESNPKWVEPEHPVYFPSAGSNNFIWISEKDGFNNLYYYDFNGNLIKQLTTNKFVTKDILTSANNGTLIYFTATGENPTNTLIYSVNLNGEQKLISQEEGTHEFALSAGGTYFYDAFSSHLVPHKAELFTTTGKKAKLLINSTDKLAEYAVGTADINTIKTDDGTVLYTRLIKPSNFDPNKQYPVLVYVYGGPHAQMITNSWLDGASLWMYWMAEQGYLVFTVDNRGSNNRGFAFESPIHRQLGTVEIEDQLLGVNYLKTLPYVDANRLAVHGWSFGGFMTTSLMLRQSGTFNVGVAGGPVTDWKYYEVMYGERYMDTPEQNPKGYEQASLMTYAGNLKGDLLLIHGTVDDVVVMQHNLALVKKFVDLGIQMDFFPYPMHQHNVRGKDRVHLMEKVLTYIMEHNL